jgi:glutamate dehydrogenase
MPDYSGTVWIQDFWLNLDDHILEKLDVKGFHETFEEAISAIWHGAAENDTLNQLVLTQQMSWREVTILRAIVRYANQVQPVYAAASLNKTLTDYPAIAAELARLFIIRHDPDLKGSRDKLYAEHLKEVMALLADVPNLDSDRMLRMMINIVKASLRTNFFQKQPHGTPKSYISIKFDSKQIHDLPEPKPFREIFVYSPKVEGIHMRFDRIARGGLRWSDRPDDFRTEVLGLVKAQNVKNAIIVPMGAKGGFVVKRPPATGDRAAFQEEGIACYKIFIQALLDITDNSVAGKTLPPRSVVCHDEPDPYLVVAADKGTATFSDTANALSVSNDFWMGDAFASGGSAGYDHKKMGITAKGAWEAVKRHFRQLGRDIQTEDFTVIGVGDMGGDVFGNGMLLSRHIRLLGAFNHVHIFCDPNPDAATSFKERQRLFREVKGWDAYDTKLLSCGGRVYNRSDKVLALTPEIRKMYGIEAESCAPNELIQAMLRYHSDLLWFGGIGTYIKSAAETHIDVGDKSNNALRINADEVNAKVIGEGANLGITQRGRIALSRRGILLNTDFIDNSAGVDTSDHEVNIKILLRDAIQARKLAEKDRNKLLATMTDEVEALVLRDNYQQTQAISLMSLRAPENLPRHTRLMQYLSGIGALDRAVEFLPDDEACRELQSRGLGLTQPELSVLQAYAKIQLTRDLLASAVPEDPDLQPILLAYFPKQLRDKFVPQIQNHQLRREIIATALANDIVNRAGSTFASEVAAKTGFSTPVIIEAFLLIAHIYGLNALWSEIEALDGKVPAVEQLRAFSSITMLLEQDVCWLLRRYGGNMQAARDVLRYVPMLDRLQDGLRDLLPTQLAAETASRVTHLTDAGFPQKLAARIAQLPIIAHGCDIIRLSEQHKVDLLQTAHLYFDIDRTFNLTWMQAEAHLLTVHDSWDEKVVMGLVESFLEAQSDITSQVLTDLSADKKAKTAPADRLSYWMETMKPQAKIVETRLSELRLYPSLSLPMLLSAEQELRKLT